MAQNTPRKNNKLAVLRKERNMSQTDVSKAINKPISQISKWENQHVSISLETAMLFSKLFGVTIPELFED